MAETTFYKRCLSRETKPHHQPAGFTKATVYSPDDGSFSIEKLTRSLIQYTRTDSEKVRAIYRWITQNIAYDVQGYNSRSNMITSPQEVLRTRRGVCDGYASLFLEMARKAGLTCVKINGYAKGYSYRPGKDFSSTNHAWNAVKIDAKWFLIDATWSAGHLNEKMKFVPSIEDFYYMTPPHHFIYSHLPEDSKWQLLSTPVSKSQFEDTVYLKSAFFRNGLDLVSHPKSMFRTDKNISINFLMRFKVYILPVLKKQGRELSDAYTSVKYEPGKITLDARFPDDGIYSLEVFVNKTGNGRPYEEAAGYQVVVNKASKTSETIFR